MGMWVEAVWAAVCPCGWQKVHLHPDAEQGERMARRNIPRHADWQHQRRLPRDQRRLHREQPHLQAQAIRAFVVRCDRCDYQSDPIQRSEIGEKVKAHKGTRMHAENAAVWHTRPQP